MAYSLMTSAFVPSRHRFPAEFQMTNDGRPGAPDIPHHTTVTVRCRLEAKPHRTVIVGAQLVTYVIPDS